MNALKNLRRKQSRKRLGTKIQELRRKRPYAFLVDTEYLVIRYLTDHPTTDTADTEARVAPDHAA